MQFGVAEHLAHEVDVAGRVGGAHVGRVRPEFFSQAALNVFVVLRRFFCSAVSSGVASCWKNTSSLLSSSHFTPALRPTPRGSKLTRS